MADSTLLARDIAHRLLSGETSGSDDPGDRIAAGARLFAGVREHLTFWFGADGVEALLRRSIDRTNGTRRATEATPLTPPASAVDVIVTTARAAPPDQGAEYIESTLTALVGLLARLVGEEMTERLLEQSRSRAQSPKHPRSIS